MKIERFIDEHGLTVTIRKTATRPDFYDWPKGSRHFSAVLETDLAAPLRVSYSQGPAIQTEPTAVDVLAAVASDASCYMSTCGLDDFAANYCPDCPPSRAVAAFEACKAAADWLHIAFGEVGRGELIEWSAEQ